MLDHTGINVSNFDLSAQFYTAALAPLGCSLLMTLDANQIGHPDPTWRCAGFGELATQKPDFWISTGQPQQPAVHFAFHAETRAAVDAFYAAAMAAGGRDNGAPGLRPHYHPNYYGAFVLDPDGQNIEAVCHTPA